LGEAVITKTWNNARSYLNHERGRPDQQAEAKSSTRRSGHVASYIDIRPRGDRDGRRHGSCS
jgi:hypothetical protein